MTRGDQPRLFAGYADAALVVARDGNAPQEAGAAAALPRAGTQARWIVDTLALLGPKTREDLLGLAPWRLHLTEAKLCARLWALEGNTGKRRPALVAPAALVHVEAELLIAEIETVPPERIRQTFGEFKCVREIAIRPPGPSRPSESP